MNPLIISKRLNFIVAGKHSTSKSSFFVEIPAIAPKIGNHFDVRGGEISFYPINKGVQPVNNADKWIREGRQTIKPGKFAALLTYYNIEGGYERVNSLNSFVETLANKIKGDEQIDGIRISSNVSDIYKMQTSDEAGYQLVNSCMRPESHHDCRKYSEFYNHIPGLRIVYKTDSSGLVFRALLWPVKHDGQNRLFLDRIYGDDKINSSLHSLAIGRDWLYRKFDSDTILLNDERVNEITYFSQDCSFVEYGEENGSAYVDTMRHVDDNTFSNARGKSIDNCEGHYFGGGCSCYSCGCEIDEDDAYSNNNGETFCSDCFYDRYFYCEKCGETYNNEDQISFNGSSYCEDCANEKGIHECSDCDGTSDTCYCVDGDYYCEECYCDKFTRCEGCDEDYENSDVKEGPDGKYYCPDCYSEKFTECAECADDFEDVTEGPDGKSYCDECYDKLFAVRLISF